MSTDEPDPMRAHTISTEAWVPRPVGEVFAWFADARNLELLTPGWLRFEIVTPTPIAMGVGTLIDYRLRVHGLPMRWRSEITAWEPGRRFVDEQRRGPYRLWVHEHRFDEEDGGTRIRDRVRYAVPGGPLAPLLRRLWVRRDLDRIFGHRLGAMVARFGAGSRIGAVVHDAGDRDEGADHSKARGTGVALDPELDPPMG